MTKAPKPIVLFCETHSFPTISPEILKFIFNENSYAVGVEVLMVTNKKWLISTVRNQLSSADKILKSMSLDNIGLRPYCNTQEQLKKGFCKAIISTEAKATKTLAKDNLHKIIKSYEEVKHYIGEMWDGEDHSLLGHINALSVLSSAKETKSTIHEIDDPKLMEAQYELSSKVSVKTAKNMVPKSVKMRKKRSEFMLKKLDELSKDGKIPIGMMGKAHCKDIFDGQQKFLAKGIVQPTQKMIYIYSLQDLHRYAEYKFIGYKLSHMAFEKVKTKLNAKFGDKGANLILEKIEKEFHNGESEVCRCTSFDNEKCSSWLTSPQGQDYLWETKKEGEAMEDSTTFKRALYTGHPTVKQTELERGIKLLDENALKLASSTASLALAIDFGNSTQSELFKMWVKADLKTPFSGQQTEEVALAGQEHNDFSTEDL